MQILSCLSKILNLLNLLTVSYPVIIVSYNPWKMTTITCTRFILASQVISVISLTVSSIKVLCGKEHSPLYPAHKLPIDLHEFLLLYFFRT